MGLGETIEPVGYGEGFVVRGGELMTARTGAVEDASRKISVFCRCQGVNITGTYAAYAGILPDTLRWTGSVSS